jgi:hypothetical protein
MSSNLLGQIPIYSSDPNAPLAHYEINGQSLWRSVYGEKADSVQGLLDSIYPDMGEFQLSRVLPFNLIIS